MPSPGSFLHSPEHQDHPSFTDQYRSQIATLNETGLLELSLRHNTLVLPGLNPDRPTELTEYPIPKEGDILRALEHTPHLKEKFNQGFTNLSIVPAASPLPLLFNRLQQEILAHHKAGKLFSSDGTALDLDLNQPVYHWEGITDTDLVYHPKEFSQNHGGLTKPQYLKTLTFPGFDVLLTESGDIPAQGNGKLINGRQQLEANQTPTEYLRTLHTNPQYHHELGLTPEAWITRFLYTLHTKNQVIDDYSGLGKLCYLLGAFHPKSGYVPFGFWYQDCRRAYVGRRVPVDRYGYSGVRSAVRIEKI